MADNKLNQPRGRFGEIMCTSERCRQGSGNLGSKIRCCRNVIFNNLETTNNEYPEQETDNASVEADS